MRILHAIAQRPGRTGSGIYLLNLIEQAAAREHRQALIAGISGSDIPKIPSIDPENFFPVRFKTPELPFHIVGMSDVMPYPSTKYSELTEIMFSSWLDSFSEKINRAVEKFNPQVIISHHFWLLSALIKKLHPKIPLIVINHGTALRQAQLAPEFLPFIGKYSPEFDHVLALTRFQQQKIGTVFGYPESSITITGNGYNTKLFHWRREAVAPFPIRMVFCGKICYTKGIDSLLDVYGSLPFPDHEIELVVVGSAGGAEFDLILQKIDKMTRPIIRTGAINQKKLGNIFRRSQIFVLPSFFEGLPLVILEALASGLSVITTDIPGVKDWLGPEITESGIIDFLPLPRMIGADRPEPGDLPGFEEHLREALVSRINRFKKGESFSPERNPSLFKKIGSFSWEKIFDRIENIMMNLPYET